jgi:hypothetical protein
MPGVGKVATVQNAARGVFVGALAQESPEVSIPEGMQRLRVMCSGGGDLTLSNTDETTLKIEGRCNVSAYGEEVRIDERDGNDITLRVPASIRSLHAENVGGGDIHGRLDPLKIHHITLSAPGGGDIVLKVPEDAAFEIAIQAPGGGDIHTDLPIETSEQNATSVKGQRNGGGDSHIRLSAHGGGDIKLTRS